MKKEIIAVIALALVVGVFAVLKNSGENIPAQDAAVKAEQHAQAPDAATWGVYKNEKYSIEMKHPSGWVPHEGLSLSYNDKDYPWLLRVCFGPAVQTKNYCGVELYIMSADNFQKHTDYSFFGEQEGGVEKPFLPKIGDYEWTSLPTIRQNGTQQEHAFIERNGLVYLLTPRNVIDTEEYGIFLKMLPTVKFSAPFSVAKWKTYQNEKVGFAISYPDTLEPLEGNALFYFRSPQNKNPNFFNVCFAPAVRTEFYCEMELYVFAGDIKILTMGDTFLGFQKCDQEKTYVPKFDGKDGVHVETCGEEGIHRNAFVQQYDTDNRVYLLTTEPRAGMKGKDEIFNKMIQSFRFLISYSL